VDISEVLDLFSYTFIQGDLCESVNMWSSRIVFLITLFYVQSWV